MNERIRELAEQANWWKPLGLPSDWDEGDYVVSPEQMKKFAELIVKECAEVCKKQSFHYAEHNNKGSAASAADACRILINLHFGVES